MAVQAIQFRKVEVKELSKTDAPTRPDVEQKSGQDEAVEAIAKVGQITRDEKMAGKPIVALSIWGTPARIISDDALKPVKALTKLRVLDLNGTAVTAKGLAEKTRLTYEYINRSVTQYRLARATLRAALAHVPGHGWKRIAQRLISYYERLLEAKAGAAPNPRASRKRWLRSLSLWRERARVRVS